MNDTIMDPEKTIEVILNKYSAMVYRIAFARTKNKYDSDDILQEVFLKYIKYNVQYTNEEHRKAWLIKTTIHTSNSLLSSAWFRKTTHFPDDLYTIMEEKSEVYYAVLKLNKKYRTVIHLFYYEELPIKTIADLLKTKESTIKSQLRRARILLQDILKGEDFDVSR